MGIKIIVTGDLCPINRNLNFIEKKDYHSVFGGFEKLSQQADLAITNLECPLTHSNTKIEKTGPCIKSDPKAIDALKYADFNLVTLANNHIMDFGSEGLKSTLNT